MPFAQPGTTNVLRLVTIDKGMVDRKPGSPQPAPRPRAKGVEVGGASGASEAARKSAELKPSPRKPAAGRPASR